MFLIGHPMFEYWNCEVHNKYKSFLFVKKKKNLEILTNYHIHQGEPVRESSIKGLSLLNDHTQMGTQISL